MATKDQISRLGTTPASASGLREDRLKTRIGAVTEIVSALEHLNREERTQCLAAVAELYGLTLVVEN